MLMSTVSLTMEALKVVNSRCNDVSYYGPHGKGVKLTAFCNLELMLTTLIKLRPYSREFTIIIWIYQNIDANRKFNDFGPESR